MNMHDMLKRLNDKFFEGELENGYPAGVGTYRFANGTIYHGKLTEGMFDGEGTLSFPRGGKFVAKWKLGELISGSYFYDDDLEYKTNDWKYGTDSDRRFWTEIQNGIKLADRPQITDREPKRWIPKGTYDLGDSYYDPRDGKSYFYNGEFFRDCPPLEAQWAATKCRVGADEEDDESDDADEGEEEIEDAQNEQEEVQKGDIVVEKAEQEEAAEEKALEDEHGDSMAALPESRQTDRAVTAGTAASGLSSRPYTACPGSMGGKHNFQDNVCTDCGLDDVEASRGISRASIGTALSARPYTACPGSMGGQHNFHENVCAECGITETEASQGPPSRIHTAQSTISASSVLSACPGTMGGKHMYAEDGKTCVECDRDQTRPPSTVGSSRATSRISRPPSAGRSRPGSAKSRPGSAKSRHGSSRPQSAKLTAVPTPVPIPGARKDPAHEFYGSWENVEKSKDIYLTKPAYELDINGVKIKLHHNAAGIEKHASCMANHLTEELYNQLKDRVTANGVTLDKCIKTGIENPGHPAIKTVGLTAGDVESYETFKELFDPVIAERHGGYAADAQHPSDMDVEKIKDPAVIDAAYVVSTRVRSGRSVMGIPLPPSCTKEERRNLETIVTKALTNLTGDLEGDYFPLAGSQSYEPKPGGMTQEEEEKLREDHFLFQEPDSTLLISGAMHRDWPDARGIFHNKNKNSLVWVNEEDHLRIISMEMGPDIKSVFARFAALCGEVEKVVKEAGYSFAHSEHLGYILTCPSNLGTGLRASMMVKLPNLGKQPNFKKMAGDLGIQVRGSAGVDSGFTGVFDLSNADRLGKSEVELVNIMIDGVAALIAKEKELESGEAATDAATEEQDAETKEGGEGEEAATEGKDDETIEGGEIEKEAKDEETKEGGEVEEEAKDGEAEVETETKTDAETDASGEAKTETTETTETTDEAKTEATETGTAETETETKDKSKTEADTADETKTEEATEATETKDEAKTESAETTETTGETQDTETTETVAEVKEPEAEGELKAAGEATEGATETTEEVKEPEAESEPKAEGETAAEGAEGTEEVKESEVEGETKAEGEAGGETEEAKEKEVEEAEGAEAEKGEEGEAKEQDTAEATEATEVEATATAAVADADAVEVTAESSEEAPAEE